METRIPVIKALEKIGCARNTLYKLMNLHGIESTREGNQRFSFLHRRWPETCQNMARASWDRARWFEQMAMLEPLTN